ncbi:hypothetical protein Tco_0513344 [Tanacetum coccineum]
MTMNEYWEYEDAKERKLWDNDSICEQDIDFEEDQEEVGDDGDIFDIWDITVEDVERIRQFLTHNVPNVIDDIIQPLISKTIHATPLEEDYVALVSKSILDDLLKEFRDEILNVTMVDEGAECSPTKDLEELERLLAKDPQSHYTEIQCILVDELCGYVLWKPSRDFTRPLGPPSDLKGLLHTLNATVIPTKLYRYAIQWSKATMKPSSSMFKRSFDRRDQASVFMAKTSVHISSGLVLQQMTSDHNRSELGIQDHNNEPSSSKLFPKVVPLVSRQTTSRQELELLFHPHIAMLRQHVNGGELGSQNKKDSDFDKILDDLFRMGVDNLKRIGQDISHDSYCEQYIDFDEDQEELVDDGIFLIIWVFTDEILNVTMVDEGAECSPTKYLEELERLLAKDPQSHYTVIQIGILYLLDDELCGYGSLETLRDFNQSTGPPSDFKRLVAYAKLQRDSYRHIMHRMKVTRTVVKLQKGIPNGLVGYYTVRMMEVLHVLMDVARGET